MQILQNNTSNRSNEAFIAWPGWKHLLYSCQLSILNSFWFEFVYFGSDYITSHRKYRVPVHFNWELSLPLFPGMILFYMSIYGLFLIAPFILRKKEDLRALVQTHAIAIFIAGICFYLFPADLAFKPPPTDMGIYTGIFNIADRINLDHNLLPSLHVTLSSICVMVFSRRAGLVWKFVLWVWAFSIALSTLLTHQHHVLDVFAGLLLAVFAVQLVYVQNCHLVPFGSKLRLER
jgi:membrane-associated phospholipid phosphatase